MFPIGMPTNTNENVSFSSNAHGVAFESIDFNQIIANNPYAIKDVRRQLSDHGICVLKGHSKFSEAMQKCREAFRLFRNLSEETRYLCDVTFTSHTDATETTENEWAMPSFENLELGENRFVFQISTEAHESKPYEIEANGNWPETALGIVREPFKEIAEHIRDMSEIVLEQLVKSRHTSSLFENISKPPVTAKLYYDSNSQNRTDRGEVFTFEEGDENHFLAILPGIGDHLEQLGNKTQLVIQDNEVMEKRILAEVDSDAIVFKLGKTALMALNESENDPIPEIPFSARSPVISFCKDKNSQQTRVEVLVFAQTDFPNGRERHLVRPVSIQGIVQSIESATQCIIRTSCGTKYTVTTNHPISSAFNSLGHIDGTIEQILSPPTTVDTEFLDSRNVDIQIPRSEGEQKLILSVLM